MDSVTGISPPDFDNQTLAVLRGRLVRYLMRSREVCKSYFTYVLLGGLKKPGEVHSFNRIAPHTMLS